MQISSRFTLAVHILLCINQFSNDTKVTSEFLAGSTNVNPVIVRNILGQLRKSGIVKVSRGTGGAEIAKPLDEITLLDLYKSVECIGNGELFSFHGNPNELCPVGKNVHNVLDKRLEQVQKALEDELNKIKMSDIDQDLLDILERKEN